MRTLLALSALALVSSACVSKKKYTDLKQDHAALQDQYEAVVDDKVGLIMDRAQLEARVLALRAENADLSGFYEDLIEDFGPAMDRGEVQVVVYPDHTAIVLTNEVTFDTNEAKLSTKGLNTVQNLASFMKDHPGRDFEVQGHTDSRPIAEGPYTDNWQLGAARALEVTDVLLSSGVNADRLSAATYASTEPRATNRTASGREKNRRVEIALEPNIDDLPFHDELIWEAAVREANRTRSSSMDDKSAMY